MVCDNKPRCLRDPDPGFGVVGLEACSSDPVFLLLLAALYSAVVLPLDSLAASMLSVDERKPKEKWRTVPARQPIRAATPRYT